MALDLRELQLQVESEHSIEKLRETLTKAVKFLSCDSQKYTSMVFRDLRNNFPIQNLEEKNIFLMSEKLHPTYAIPDEFKSYALGLFSANEFPIYADRLVYPVRDVKGNVMGLCGWDPVEQPKYLDSKTYGYNAKRNTLYGMEKLKDYYTSTNPVFITEGIVCCNYLRANGFNSLALLGSSISSYVVEILKRFERRCVLIPDNDEAGLHIYTTALKSLPKAQCFVSVVAKDIDDTRSVDNHKYEQDLLNDLSKMSNPFYQPIVFRKIK